MPIYEYRCLNCRKRVTIFVRTIGQAPSPVCDRCHGNNLERLVSSFAVMKSWGASLDKVPFSDAGADVDEEDPRAMAGYLRRMKHEMGEEAGPEFDEMVDRMEAGELPDEDAGGDAEDADL
ncbi:MAG: zinc ribbon domain-containing protein [Chloroflexi bacterium]|nr:zinc ribbon domain-containing protein [Chloroflexota bacterium]